MEQRRPEMVLSGPCDSCTTALEFPFPIEINPTHDRLIMGWPNLPFPPLTCRQCDAPWPFGPIECIYWHPEWTGLILGQPMPAINVLHRAVQWIVPMMPATKVIRVMPITALSYILRHPGCSHLWTDVKGRVTSHWDQEVDALIEIADMALEHDLNGLSYMILAGVVQENVEFFFIPQIREALDLTAHAAGADPLPAGTEKRTAIDDYREMVSALHPSRPAPELDDYSVWSDTPYDETTGQPLEGVPNIIVQDSPSPADRNKIWLRVLAAGGLLRGYLTADNRVAPSPHWKEHTIESMFRHLWSRLDESQQTELEVYFLEIAGLSLKDALQLN